MTRRRALWLTGIASVLLLAVLVALDLRMQDEGGWGIIDFEVAGSMSQSRDILGDWGDAGRDAARLSLWLDFPYLAAYGAFWALAVAAVRDMARRRGWVRFAAVAGVLIPLPVAAAGFDALEDVALLLALGEHGGAAAPRLGAIFAALKFVAIGVTVALIVAALIRRALERWRAASAVALGFVALVAVALVVNALVTSGETAAADRDAPGRIVSLPAGDVHVLDRGPRSRSAVVLVHGFTASVAWWSRVLPTLARSERVVAIDLLGHGASEKPKEGYGMEEQARLVLGVLRRLGVDRALLVGHSMGGAVVVAAAEEDRRLPRGVMIIGTTPDRTASKGPGATGLAFVPVLGQAIDRLAPDSAVKRRIEEVGFAEGVEAPDQFVEDTKRVTHTAFVESGKASTDFRKDRPLDARMAATGLPLLVLFGTEDNTARPRAAASWDVPGAKVVQMRGVGHSPLWERPRPTARLILRFARGVLGS